MSFTREAREAADQYALPDYDEPLRHGAAGSRGWTERDTIPLGTQQQRFSRQAGYSQPGYASQYTDRDIYTHPSTQRRARDNVKPREWLDRANNPTFLAALATRVNNLLQRRLVEAEEIRLRNYVIGVNPRMFTSFTDDEVVNALSKGFIDNMHRGRISEEVDTHEILKHEIKETGETDGARSHANRHGRRIDPRVPVIDIGSFMGSETPFQILETFNPSALECEARLVLDSHYRQVESPMNNSRYTWNILYDTHRSRGTANIIGSKVRDIISLSVLPIRIPNPTVTTGLTSYKRVHMFLHQFGPQSFASQNGKNFHFVFEPTADGADHQSLSPAGETESGGRIVFDKKVTKFDEITFSFTDPVTELIFRDDRIDSTAWLYGAVTTITLASNHNLVNGELITMDDFTSTNVNADRGLIAQFNTQTHSITVTAANQFTIPVNTTTIAGGIANLIIPIFIEKRRMFIYLKIKYTTPEDTYP